MKRIAVIAVATGSIAITGSAHAMNRATPHRRPATSTSSTYVQQYSRSRIGEPGHVYVQ
ncbi:MAG TPA: hypothetical protein VJQ85_03670 [Gaiellaceae bacterium]|nr:hypothetical protein [Gaiellaceae bacterium]